MLGARGCDPGRRHNPVGRNSRVRVPTELLAQGRLCDRRQHIETKPRRPDGVRFVDDLCGAPVETLGRTGDRQRQQEAEQPERDGFNGVEPRGFAVRCERPAPQVPAGLLIPQHSENESSEDG
jgi:hypothetical protein